MKKESGNCALQTAQNKKRPQSRPKESSFSYKVAIVFGLEDNAHVNGFPLAHSLKTIVLP